MRAPGSGCSDSPELPAEGTTRYHHLQQVLVPQCLSTAGADVTDPTALVQPCIAPQLPVKGFYKLHLAPGPQPGLSELVPWKCVPALSEAYTSVLSKRSMQPLQCSVELLLQVTQLLMYLC